MPRCGSAIIGKAITREIPAPAGEVSLVTVIPWTLVKRGMKKEIITPLDAPAQFREEAEAERRDKKLAEVSALVKALGLAYHWQKLLDSGKINSLTELAEREGISKQRASLILKTIQLSPAIVENLLNDTAPQRLTLDYFKKNTMPLCWAAQDAQLVNLT